MNNVFDDADIVFKYTREEALHDGILIDISELAREAGIKFPVAITRGVFQVLSDTRLPGQDFKGRAWDMLMVFRVSTANSHGDEVRFNPYFALEINQHPQPVSMWAKCGPGDDRKPVITIMLDDED